MKSDFRSAFGQKLRAQGANSRTIGGCFAAYNVVSVIDGWFQEMLLSNCFSRSIASGICDYMGGVAIKALYQHLPENLLGSVKSRTLRLFEQMDGLFADCDMPNHTLGDQVLESVRRGDLDEASIRYLPTATEWVMGVEMDLIKIIEGDLAEVSVCSFPKTQSTSISMRANTLPKEIEEKPLVLRAINRYKQEKLEPQDQDKQVLVHYRSLIEPIADEDTRQILIKALPPEQKIIPVSTMQSYLDALPKNLLTEN